MTQESLNGAILAQMAQTSARRLNNNADKIDALNVFPVPDGDTGTNMNLSVTSGAEEVKRLGSENITEVAEAFSKGLLMGARGNSGVILSQLFRGFARGLSNQEVVSAKELANALDNGVKAAYKAVMKPVEGTILTVAKDAAETAVVESETEKDITVLMEHVVQEAKASLKRTPELLPVLKEAGVVDSGGQGLVTIYEGFLAALKGEEVPEQETSDINMEDMINAEHHKIVQDVMNTADIEYGYCTEFMVQFEADKLKKQPFDEDAFRQELSRYGDSLLVVSDDELAKIHIHVEYPGEVMTIGQRYGSLTHIKIDNMREQHTSIVGEQTRGEQPDNELNAYGVVTVATGSGIKELFESLGATAVIEGGQTMNPSTKDIADAIDRVNAQNVLILPNNKNIIMAAEQAAELSEATTSVVPTKTIPQGISALLAFHSEMTIDDNHDAMEEASRGVKTGQVTHAVRDTQMDGITIKKGHFMGIADGAIKVSSPDKQEAAEELLKSMITDDDDILTILQGEDASSDDVQTIADYVEEHFDELETETHNGQQPVYPFILALE